MGLTDEFYSEYGIGVCTAGTGTHKNNDIVILYHEENKNIDVAQYMW